MPATQICGGSRPSGLIRRSSNSNQIKEKCRRSLSLPREQACKFIASSGRKDANNEKGWKHSARHEKIFAPCVKHRRKPCLPFSGNQLSSDFEMETSKFEGRNVLDSSENRLPELTTVPNRQSVSFDVKRELLRLSIPAITGQAIDPLAQLMETAYIGRLGSMELGSAGISVNIFNYISKLFNIPLLSVATSFVAEDISKYETKASASEKGDSSNGQPSDGLDERKQLPSVSTALTLAIGIGVFEAIALSLGSGLFLCLMGISLDSPMRIPAQRFLSLRALGAPAVVVSLALQGVFRGFKDTKTPVFCLGIGNLLAVLLFPMLMYYFRLGVTGAALSTVISQYTVTFLMLWFLNKRAILLPPKLGSLQFGGYIKSGGFLLGRTLAVLTTLTFGTSMAARQGPTAMAAHQICIQVWLAVSLLTDALGTSAQAMVASYISKGDYKIVREITGFVLKIGLLIGIALSVILGASFGSLATLFTNDADVLSIVRAGVLFVSASQPLNSLAYIFDGLHYGISDYAYAAQAMMIVGAISSLFLLYAPSVIGLHGVWFGLTLFMGLRMVAGYLRLQSKTGPWWFLHTELQLQRTELAS